MDLDLLDDDLEFDPLSNRLDKGTNAENGEVDFSALQQAFDTTFGRSSTPKTAQFSVKFQIEGTSHLIASYCAIVNFATERHMIEQKRRYADESINIIKEHVKFIKKRYKELCGKTLNVKEFTTSDSVEIIGMNSYNPRKTAYYRRKTIFSIA